MKKIKSIIIAISLFAVLSVGIVISSVFSFEQSAQAQTKPVQKWETLVLRGITMPESLHGVMNIRGEDGWELVNVVQTNEGNFVAFLKRPKP